MNESKDEMINRIVEFRKNGNDLWNFYGGSRPLTKEDYDQYEQVKKDYDALTKRTVLEKLTDEEISVLKESGIGGEFGNPSEVENISKEYGIDANLLMQIYYYFNGMDNFAKEYISYMKDPAKKQEEADERFYLKLFDFVDKLNKRRRIIRNFDMNEEDFIYRGKYEKLCRDLKINQSGDYLFVKEEELVEIVETLSEKEQELIQKIYEEKATIQEVADDFDISMKRVKTMRAKALKKIYDKYTEIMNEETITKEAREEFIDKFFENNSIYKTEDAIELDSDLVDSLNDIYDKGYNDAREEKRLFLADPANILVTDLNLSARAYNVFEEYGYKTCKDVIDNFKEIKQIKGFGKKTVDIVLEEIRSRGFEIVDEDEVEEVVYAVKDEDEDEIEIDAEDDEVEEDDGPVYIDDKVEALASLAFMQAKQSKILSPKNIKVTDLNFNARILGILKKNEITTLQDIIDKYDEFPNLSSFGPKTIETLVDAVHNQGFKFNFENEVEEETPAVEEKEEFDLDSFDKSIDELDDIEPEKSEEPEEQKESIFAYSDDDDDDDNEVDGDDEFEDDDDNLDDNDDLDDEDDDEFDYEEDDSLEDESDDEDEDDLDEDEIEEDDDELDYEDDEIEAEEDIEESDEDYEDDSLEADEEEEVEDSDTEEEEDEEADAEDKGDSEEPEVVPEPPRMKGYRLKQAEELLAEIDELDDIEEVKNEKEPQTDEEKREKLVGLIEKARSLKKNLIELINRNKKID